MKKIGILTVFVFLSTIGFSQVEKFKAMMIYQTAVMTKFPAAKEAGDFVIGVYNANDVKSALDEIAAKKMVGTRKIVVKEIKGEGEAGACSMVFVPAASVGAFVNACKAGGTLLYSEDEGSCAKGAHFSFFIGADNKPKFEVSESNLSGAGLTTSAKLLGMGKKV